MSYYDYEYTPPIRVRGGIRANSKRGAFGSNWWAKRWLKTLEEFDIGARLDRGKSYARQGQVTSIDIQPGAVTALVQGSRSEPYKVDIKVQTIQTEDWERVASAMAEQPVIAASLLAGRMPETIEETFQNAGLSMFPSRMDDLSTNCSCPDWSNPCKHIAATYLLLGEEFDRDPFLIFRMRGMNRDELLGMEFRQSAQTLEGTPLTPEPLEPNPETFWTGQQHSENGSQPIPHLDTEYPDQDAALPQQLGRFPFWQGEQELVDALKDIYMTASKRAIAHLESMSVQSSEKRLSDLSQKSP